MLPFSTSSFDRCENCHAVNHFTTKPETGQVICQSCGLIVERSLVSKLPPRQMNDDEMPIYR